MEALIRLAKALHVSLDSLVFEEGEHGPDERLRLQFEALAHLDQKEPEAIETVIASVLHMHDAKRWQQASAPAPAPAKAAGKRSTASHR